MQHVNSLKMSVIGGIHATQYFRGELVMRMRFLNMRRLFLHVKEDAGYAHILLKSEEKGGPDPEDIGLPPTDILC